MHPVIDGKAAFFGVVRVSYNFRATCFVIAVCLFGFSFMSRANGEVITARQSRQICRLVSADSMHFVLADEFDIVIEPHHPGP